MKDLEVGQRAEVKRIFTRQDLAEYAILTGDKNPLFCDEVYLAKSWLKRSIVPGALLGGLFSYLLGTKLPGTGTMYLKQEFSFPTPAYLDEEITAVVEITSIRAEKGLVNLDTICTNSSGEVVCEGKALVMVGRLEK